MIWIRVRGKVPSKANTYRIVKKGRHSSLAKGEESRAFEQEVATAARHLCSEFGGMPFPTPERVEIWLVWHRHKHDGRRRDLDNAVGKAVLDGLTAGGIWDDDCQVSTIHATVRYDGEEDEEWLDIALMRDPAQPMPVRRSRRARAATPKRASGTGTSST